MKRAGRIESAARVLAAVIVLAGAAVVVGVFLLRPISGGDIAYPAASQPPVLQPDWQAFQSKPDPDAPMDEAQSGITARGTPVARRNERAFPAETSNIFSEVDRVPSGPNGALEPFDYTVGGKLLADGQQAIQGQNTWILWGGGNDSFWGWLQEHNYGLTDFLVLLDSRKRDGRFKRTGLINQPGMKRNDQRLLGLYLDAADGDRILLKAPGYKTTEPPFTPGDPELYEKTIAALPDDGVNTAVYGYPSGVVGLRLVPNPDFFGNTPDAARARSYWHDKVTSQGDAYYEHPARINSDPQLVRPFRVSFSCGFCHVAPHPLAPPDNPEKPEWKHLSSLIGNQYWRPEKVFTSLLEDKDNNFFYHFIASQQPGTIDTSLVTTDHINNANTIISIFDVPARLNRAMRNEPEAQSSENLLTPGLEQDTSGVTPRHTPRVLLDGADSVGVFGSLSRVYLNIGTFSQEWGRLHNPIIGYAPQRPFSVVTAREHSAYWRALEKYRVPYLKSFFTYESARTGQSITAPLKLAHTPEGRAKLKETRDEAFRGRDVFLKNCAICHSSKQPEGFKVGFSPEWEKANRDEARPGARLTLPMAFGDWDYFRKSAAYQGYVALLLQEVSKVTPERFFESNFLSTEIRIPVTLVGTNSARAMATNAMRGQIWDNFSSETYKNLPSVGMVRFYNPFSGRPADEWGNNDAYDAPGGGPGYYRPASLISLWATAPYLHNNALGKYTGDPTVKGRLAAFDDGIDKLFYKAKRASNRMDRNYYFGPDIGWIYRTPRDSFLSFPAASTRQLVEGVLGKSAIPTALFAAMVLVVVLVVLTFLGKPRHAGFVLLLVAVLLGVLVVRTRVDTVYLELWLLPALALTATVLFWVGALRRGAARIVLAALCILCLWGVLTVHRVLDGKVALPGLPIPEGTPVNLLMNLNPDAPFDVTLDAVAGLARGVLQARKHGLKGEEARAAFEKEAAEPLLRASKCPDFVMDRGHWFAENLSDREKEDLKAFLMTL